MTPVTSGKGDRARVKDFASEPDAVDKPGQVTVYKKHRSALSRETTCTD